MIAMGMKGVMICLNKRKSIGGKTLINIFIYIDRNTLIMLKCYINKTNTKSRTLTVICMAFCFITSISTFFFITQNVQLC